MNLQHEQNWIRLAATFVAAAVVACGPAPASAQSLVAEPSQLLVDEQFTIRVHGVAPGERIMVTASMTDAGNQSWNAFAGFQADRNGSVDLRQDAPIHGSYSGVHPMGLIHGMTPPPGAGPLRFQTAWDHPMAVVFRLWRDRKEVAQAGATLRYLDDSVLVENLDSEGLVGKLFVPKGAGPHPAVLVLGGSEGGLGAAEDAALFAAHGLTALALAYFGTDHLPEELAEIPLEYFERAISWLGRHPSVDRGRIGVVGTSKGRRLRSCLHPVRPNFEPWSPMHPLTSAGLAFAMVIARPGLTVESRYRSSPRASILLIRPRECSRSRPLCTIDSG